GYTVPEDIVTKIYELRQAKRSLIDLVTVTNVKTMSGARTYKKRSQVSGFAKVGEGGKISATSTPEFGRIKYTIDKYAGYMPITNELLDDTDENIVKIISEWFADESRVTGNKLILEQLDSKYSGEGAPVPAAIAGIDDIKKVLNIELGQAFKPTSKIITNDDGLQWLDTLKDTEGKYLLQPNPADPMRMQLCAGATTIPVDVVPNCDLKSDATKGIPMYIGDLKEGIEFFNRKALSISASEVAAIGDLNAYEEDLTLYRGIEREDVVLRDDEAFVKGFVAVAEG
ncbi:MAG: phage major capsid protein, partial [Raoultibacter sp.]